MGAEMAAVFVGYTHLNRSRVASTSIWHAQSFTSDGRVGVGLTVRCVQLMAKRRARLYVALEPTDGGQTPDCRRRRRILALLAQAVFSNPERSLNL